MRSENIRYVAKYKKIKIGDIENAINVSKGYFSRKTNKISAERLYQVSKILNVSMEDLIEDKYRQQIIEEKIKDLQEELADMRGEE